MEPMSALMTERVIFMVAPFAPVITAPCAVMVRGADATSEVSIGERSQR
jgi:hypothetical protein